MAPAKVQVCGSQDAQKLQDIAAEKCSMPYRAPELFNVESYCVIDQRTDIWVKIDPFKPMLEIKEVSILESRLYLICLVLLEIAV